MSNTDSKTGAIVLLSLGAALSVLILGALREPLGRMWDEANEGPKAKDKTLRRYDADQVVTRVLPEALEFSDVYVPVETELSWGEDDAVEFRPTLSIRNTSEDEALYVAAVHLFGSDGQVQRSYLKHTLEVAPFASIQFEMTERSSAMNEEQEVESEEQYPRPQCAPQKKGVDPCAVPASHFVVTWGATQKMRAPLIETIMVDQEGRVSHIRKAQPMRSTKKQVQPKQRDEKAVPPLPPLAANLAPLPRTPASRPTPRTREPEYELIRYDSDYGLRSRGL